MRKRGTIRNLARKPIARFLMLGAVVYFGQSLWLHLHPPGSTIVVSAAQVQDVRAHWQRQWGQPPDARELSGALRQEIDDEILYREAIRLGLDRSDPVVRSRLVQNMRFAGDSGEADGLFDHALALGMDRQDYVVRQRLIERMGMLLQSGVRLDDADVRAYVAAHAQTYAQPAVYETEQRYFSGDLRADARHDAEAALARLRAGDSEAGDPFLLGPRFDGSATQLTRRLGASLASAIVAAPVGEWTGPVQSAWGWHLLRVLRAKPGAPPVYADVKRQAYYALLEKRQKQALREGLQQLRARYPARIDAGAVTVAQR